MRVGPWSRPTPEALGGRVEFAVEPADGRVRLSVRRMGGRIRLESEPGRGSTFWFDLPRA